ncbi:hypothetical protein PH213_20240 [Streptomyces sp. SRF1]|uniref:hypothetical protein n=1 Tax=Streptomyces sp. SRF1 TaxID=1549642 RepID=UPI0025B1244B|nr:hypothetical protein [Streptomyces sp. SRF1]MDN3056836.1 hypothetical protein [Streptomyces sp. SRF1]
MSMTVHGAVAAGETVTYWVIYDDGSTGLIDVTNGEAPILAKPGRLVTEEEYTARLAEIQAEQDRRREEQEAADLARTREDYLALIAAGVPEATARRMSGYTGPAVDPEES